MPNRRHRLSAGNRSAHSLLCLLLLAVVVRMLIPVGYMPDADALKQGRFALAFCSVTLPAVATHAPGPAPHANAHSAHNAGHAQEHSHGHAAPAVQAAPAHAMDTPHENHAEVATMCPLGALLAQAVLLPVATATPLHRVASGTVPTPGVQTAPARQTALTGPPLGSRAPPLAFG